MRPAGGGLYAGFCPPAQEAGAAAIRLVPRLPEGSSDRPEGRRAGHPYPPRRTGSLLRGLAPGGVYRASVVTYGPGELLPRPFTLAPGTRPGAVYSLWHFPPVARGRR